jgi:hypothetical protein
MPNPKVLKIGQSIIFYELAKEWAVPGYMLQEESRIFMTLLIKRKRRCIINKIDEFGVPWFEITLRVDGKAETHSWGIFEKSGWKQIP